MAPKLGFIVLHVPVDDLIRVNPDPPYNLIASSRNIANAIPFGGSTLTIWGNPADPRPRRRTRQLHRFPATAAARSTSTEKPFLTLPRGCTGPAHAADLRGRLLAWDPDLCDPDWTSGSGTHDDATPPNPQGMTGCGKLAFNPTITAKPTTKAAQSPTGLDFSLDVDDEGLTNPDGPGRLRHQESRGHPARGLHGQPLDRRRPRGLHAEADWIGRPPSPKPGAGCPNASKIGTVEVETPAAGRKRQRLPLQAAPYDNPFDSLIALYMVIKNPTLGIIVKQPLKVEPDPVTGRLTTVAEDLPQLPFSHFSLHFREGASSPLGVPAGLRHLRRRSRRSTPGPGGSRSPPPRPSQIITGPDAGPCPTGGLPPFKPGLIAGTDQQRRRALLAPSTCASSETTPNRRSPTSRSSCRRGSPASWPGSPTAPMRRSPRPRRGPAPTADQEELASPSCPAASEIGRTLVGAGVGPALAYAPGKIYLAGPYNGSDLSIVAITAGKSSVPSTSAPWSIRQALKIDPETAEVFIDATGSDPIPHIIKGIPVHLRDIRAYVDQARLRLQPDRLRADLDRLDGPGLGP